MIKSGALRDVWDGNSGFTWHRANSDSFSCIDRVLFSSTHFQVKRVNADWAKSFSDHACVEVELYRKMVPISMRTKLPRLDPSLLNTPEIRDKIRSEFNTLIDQTCGEWNPHLKLEYAKMALRSVVEKVQADVRKKDKSLEDEVNEELNLAMDKLAKSIEPEPALLEYVEELRARKEAIVDVKGRRLAERLGTKWYNEGEKSTRYFLRLLNRRNPDTFVELSSGDGVKITDPKEIETEIVNFYKNLYETYEHATVVNNQDLDFFSHLMKVDREDDQEVSKPITANELLQTLQTCKDSAPGPDGISYSYLRFLWSTFGKLLVDAWNYSLNTGDLPPSHKTSLLKLIPKAGKDISKLTNWRPITLSNCDHKLITKTYSNRICEKVSKLIDPRQTAYLKGRVISDNIRSLKIMMDLANSEENIDGIIVSLDAKKAFDSVEHSYISRILGEFGLNSFIPIFELLYHDLRSDIIVNGKVVPGFRILRGVKQGDSLSCVLFIMCMEPLIRNIESNQEIEPIYSHKLGSNLPKCYGYADDITGAMKRTRDSIQNLFNEYERLTNWSGLQLNADKTEILPFYSGNVDRLVLQYNVTYLNDNFRLRSLDKIKINGIYFQQNHAQMRAANVENAVEKINRQLTKWSQRNISVLGKILLLKTFGISQIIFYLQSLVLDDSDFKQINSLLYKFLWNRNYQAAKAPERIKRDIINKPVKLGGFGMLDIKELDNSLKLKAIGRLFETNHPMLSLVYRRCNKVDFFHPRVDRTIEGFSCKGLELLGNDRTKLLELDTVNRDVKVLSLLRESPIRSWIRKESKNSLWVFAMHTRGITKLGQLNRLDLDRLERLTNYRNLCKTLRETIDLVVLPAPNNNDYTLYPINHKLKTLSKCTAKEIRDSRVDGEQICIFKIGLILTPNESKTWLHKIRLLTSVNHRSLLLKVAHGDIYSNERKFRFGLRDDPFCDRCGIIETTHHKLFECAASVNLWRKTLQVTGSWNENQALDLDQRALGANTNATVGNLTLHVEVLKTILQGKLLDIPPANLLKRIVKNLAMRETNRETKNELIDIEQKLNEQV